MPQKRKEAGTGAPEPNPDVVEDLQHANVGDNDHDAMLVDQQGQQHEQEPLPTTPPAKRAKAADGDDYESAIGGDGSGDHVGGDNGDDSVRNNSQPADTTPTSSATITTTTNNKNNKKKRDNKKAGGGGGGGGGRKGEWKQFAQSNDLLFAYYQRQGEVSAEDGVRRHIVDPTEWDTFAACLRTELPSTFRVTFTKEPLMTPLCDFVRDKIANDYRPSLNSIEIPKATNTNNTNNINTTATATTDNNDAAGQSATATATAVATYEPAALPLQPLEWYPVPGTGTGNSTSNAGAGEPSFPLAWQFNLSRHKMRRLDKPPPEIDAFHAFLVLHNDLGTITRQESVSMVPPLFLDVQAHHWVLDMCAAPGSKTTQMIEMLHANNQRGDGDSTPLLPTGVVVANDADPKRCHTLTFQIKRLNSHATIVTNHEAQQFPGLRTSSSSSSSSGLEFDRILCDVPCSGDGTIRKSPEVWQRWSPQYSGSLHPIQFRIVERAIRLLRRAKQQHRQQQQRPPRIVYSTCSLNPIEDEAVIAQVLTKYGDQVELVDVSDMHPELIRSKGLMNWEVMDTAGEWFDSYDNVPAEKRRFLKPSFFPPPASLNLPLHRCMRFLPHHQNRGGFFVAVLQLKPDVAYPVTAAAVAATNNGDGDVDVGDAAAAAITTDAVSEQQHQQQQSSSFQESFLEIPKEEQESLHSQLRDFFGLLPGFPLEQLIASSSQLTKLYMSSTAARDIVRLQASSTQHLKLRHVGIRIFEKVTSSAVDVSEGGLGSACAYRPCQEAAWFLSHPDLTDGRRVVVVPRTDITLLLDQHDPYITKFTAEVQEVLNKMPVGGCIFVYQPSSNIRIPFVGWKATVSAHLLLKKQDKTLLKKLIETTPSL
jgi:16S rRNA C967 or C1407 C5-methylase (RsmB/RsmF family)